MGINNGIADLGNRESPFINAQDKKQWMYIRLSIYLFFMLTSKKMPLSNFAQGHFSMAFIYEKPMKNNLTQNHSCFSATNDYKRVFIHFQFEYTLASGNLSIVLEIS
jgi:hypothetical protein